MPPDRLAAASLPRPQQSPEASQAKAHAILSQHQFARARPNIFEQVLRWLSMHLGNGLTTLASGGWGALAGWAVLILVVGLVAAVVGFALRGVRRDPERPEAPFRVQPRRTATDWRTEAEAFEADGQWKEGLRCRYRALIAELIEAKAVLDLPGRTTGEYRGDVAVTLPAVASAFAGATELFERAWYGDRATGADESRRFAELAAAVLVEAQRHRRQRVDPDDSAAWADHDDQQLVAP